MNFDFNILHKYESDKLISIRKHKDVDLFICNYTAKCQYSAHWDPITIHSRGLILDSKGEIHSRGMKKFFDFENDRKDIIGIHEKVDGSLIIPYIIDNQLYLTTRGSFESNQCKSAQELLSEYSKEFSDLIISQVNDKTFPVFEFVDPDNPIIIKYNKKKLVYIGNVDLYGIIDYTTYKSQYKQFVQCLNTYNQEELYEPKNNFEGYVIEYSNGESAKYKLEPYKLASKWKSLENPRKAIIKTILNNNFSDFLKEIPDEYYSEVKEIYNSIMNDYQQLYHRIINIVNEIDHKKYNSEKEMALSIIENYPKDKHFIFSYMKKSKKNLETLLFKHLLEKP